MDWRRGIILFRGPSPVVGPRKTAEQLDGGQLRCSFERERGVCRLSAAGMHLFERRRGIGYVGTAPRLTPRQPTGRRADYERRASELSKIWKELGEQLGLAVLSVAGYAQTRQLYQLNGDHA